MENNVFVMKMNIIWFILLYSSNQNNIYIYKFHIIIQLAICGNKIFQIFYNLICNENNARISICDKETFQALYNLIIYTVNII